MVCKEEVFLWFKNLKGSKRIEAMCGFLNMCYPLELRFYGTCLEDLGRRDFLALRDEKMKANSFVEISKIKNISDHSTRSKLIVVLSLLNSSNSQCAKELFRVLSDEIKIESLTSLGVLSEPKLVEQYLLLLTLAQHHPAFTFAQQTYLSDLSLTLENYARELNPRTKFECEESCLSEPVFPYIGVPPATSEKDIYNVSPHSCSSGTSFPRRSDTQQCQVRITNLKVKPSHKKMLIRIRVAWGNNRVTESFKTPHDLSVFHQKLLQMFPSESKVTNQEKFIPPLPHVIYSWNKQTPLNESITTAVAEYIQQLNTRLPGYVLESDFVTSFFMPSNHNRATVSRCKGDGQSDIPPRNPRLRSLTIYNSQMSDSSPGHRSESRQKVSHNSLSKKYAENCSAICGKASPQNSPLQSPTSSPYVSPVNSETNSRAASPWSHASGTCLASGACSVISDSSTIEKAIPKEPLHDHWDVPRNYKIEDLQAMPIEELESLGILRDTSKCRKAADSKSPPNGIIGSYLPRSAAVMKTNLLTQSVSNDSSPVCSEYSSPPQSPSPAEVCNQSSSLSSSNDENSDKRPPTKALSELCKIEDSETIAVDSSFKRMDEDPLSLKGNLSRTSVSVLPFAVPYSTIVTQMPPPQNMKPAYLSIPCRTNNAPQHMSPGTVVFDNQFSRVPLPSALTFLPGPQRPHAVTPDRVMSSANIPISTVSPFPVTSGCATVPCATCCITTHKSSTVTVVTNSVASGNRHNQKNTVRDSDIATKPVQQPSDAQYATAYILSSSTQLTAVSCPCYTSSSARPSPAPSPSMSPGANPQPSAVPVSLPYIGMPYVFHHSIPFLQAQAPANGFVPQPGIGNSGQGFSYALPNGITAIPPELMYPGQTFTLQSPSSQGNPGQVASPASQCYGAFPQTAAVPLKLITCYNCGKGGHHGTDCKEQTMDDLNKAGKFQLNYNPLPKIPDSHE